MNKYRYEHKEMRTADVIRLTSVEKYIDLAAFLITRRINFTFYKDIVEPPGQFEFFCDSGTRGLLAKRDSYVIIDSDNQINVVNNEDDFKKRYSQI